MKTLKNLSYQALFFASVSTTVYATSENREVEFEIQNCTQQASYCILKTKKISTKELEILEKRDKKKKFRFDRKETDHTLKEKFEDFRVRITFDKEPCTPEWFNTNAVHINKIFLPDGENSVSLPSPVSFPNFVSNKTQYIVIPKINRIF